MLSFYKTEHIGGIGSSLIIICDGDQDIVRFAEFHTLLQNADCKRTSGRLLTQISREILSDDDFRNQALSTATASLQSHVDEQTKACGIAGSAILQSAWLLPRRCGFDKTGGEHSDARAAKRLAKCACQGGFSTLAACPHPATCAGPGLG